MRNPTHIALLLTSVIAMLDSVCAMGGELAITFDDAPRSGSELFDGQQRTDALIEHARAQGWQIIPARSAYQDEIAEFDAAAVAGNQGRIAAIAQANGIASTQSRHESESEEFLQELFEREKIFR